MVNHGDKFKVRVKGGKKYAEKMVRVVSRPIKTDDQKYNWPFKGKK